MKKNKNFIFGISLYFILHISLYFISKIIQGNPNLIHSSLDNKIPFINFFVIFYVLWYLYLLLIPFLLYKRKSNRKNTLMWSLIIGIFISNLIFIIYPSTVFRENINNNNIFNFLISVIYYFDNPAINCLPSMHTLFSLFYIYAVFNNKDFKPWEQYTFIITNILIILSTIFIKQHSIIDVLSAFIISIPIWYIGSKIKTNYFNLFIK